MSKKKDNLPTPFNDLPIADFLKSIDGFFQDAFRNFNFASGFPVHQYETNNQYIIEAQLPGIKKEQINLDIYSNHIKISVENSEIIEEKNEINNSFKSSKSFHKAQRVIMVPFTISVRDVKASFRDGLLKITIPNKKRTIEIE
ncbi:Hsp20/alpha crystallin family protein [Anaerobacillus isosaccharinicus]|uniref:Hsp20/alpha crystallin family protein n=1 Tax=Anaerobacillus isosaccharinicus TaxID=1532552 RepID=A0A1S2M1J9_9BACI|nr:Hsp20/alpha crystallin family protein [Anaerobacillus isosaccharinicus]MBA5587541.1 Hsp20/alpha crystallin family protein [Anaerobacillus isosaccharinicus]QOY34279.1 Hsp20/alpha crystallin family protein [Anaerobacillus isosaccharinicus]